jgi:UDP-N-acetylglucosamine 2-epimerase
MRYRSTSGDAGSGPELFKIVPQYDLDVMKDRQICSKLPPRPARFREVLLKERPIWYWFTGIPHYLFWRSICLLLQFRWNVEAGLRTETNTPLSEEITAR